MVECKVCRILNSIFDLRLSNYGYWLLTELFVELHNGKDYCMVDGN